MKRTSRGHTLAFTIFHGLNKANKKGKKTKPSKTKIGLLKLDVVKTALFDTSGI